MILFRRVAVVLIAAIAGPTVSMADDSLGPNAPFRMGEGYADRPATCDTIGHWIDHAPQTSDRVTLTISGPLAAVEWDGTLAYLVMCDEKDVQVMCVTYSSEGRHVGDTVLFAGGYVRAGERRIMLDPCLAAPPED